GIGDDVFNPVSDLVYVSGHFRQCDIEKSRKKQQETNDHVERLIISDQSPVPVNGSLLIHMQSHDDINKDVGKAGVINAVDHIIQQKAAYQHSQSRYQKRLQKHAELEFAIIILQRYNLLPILS